MKWLTRKKQDKILECLVANEIIIRQLLNKLPNDTEIKTYRNQFVENNTDIAYTVAGISGMFKASDLLDQHLNVEHYRDITDTFDFHAS